MAAFCNFFSRAGSAAGAQDPALDNFRLGIGPLAAHGQPITQPARSGPVANGPRER